MLKRYSSPINQSIGLAVMLLLLVGAAFISYACYGPYYSPDTVNYFDFSQNILNDSLWRQIYSPLYPFVLHCLSAFPFLSLYDGAHLLILLQYGVGVYFLFLWTNITAKHYRLGRTKQLLLLLLVLISFHSWWSFRIVTWAHADASFYCLLIIWVYFLSQYYLKGSRKKLLILSVVSAVMIWFKLNALFLVPFYFFLFIFGAKQKTWLVPLCCTLFSYLVYRYFFQQHLLPAGVQESFEVSSYLTHESLNILSNNLTEFFRTTLGFVFSDVLTAFIPYSVALAGGLLVLLSLFILLAAETRKKLPLSSLFLLFGFIYLLCQLGFQQMIGFEEINYRTLSPYFLGCSGYVWLKVVRMDGKRNRLLFILAFFMFSHTMAGHFWLWQRKEVNSLFEVERLEGTDMSKKIQSLHQGSFQGALFVSDHPEKLALLLEDPYVVHYHPEFVFVQGKRRPVPDLEKQMNGAALRKKLLEGMAVVVLFDGDENLLRFARENGMAVFQCPEGAFFHRQ